MEATLEQHQTELVGNDGADPAAATPAQLFRYSTWLHLGPGAEECEAVDEDKGTNECSNPLHFHAWCRLPNQLQHRQIREKALAAKARRTRQLRDAETDANAILEEDLDQLARMGEEARQVLVEELIGHEWWKDYFEAVADVKDLEEGEEEHKPFATIEDDQARFARLEALPVDKRPKDEYEELERHLARYGENVERRQQELVKPRREALSALDINALLDRVRDQRIAAASNQEFMAVYGQWEWFIGSLKVPRGERVFKSIEVMEAAAPEILEALQDTFRDLERTQTTQGASGNS